MRGNYCTRVLLGLLLGGGLAVNAQTNDTANPEDQTPAPAAASTPAPAPAPVDPGPLHQWGTDFSFMFDGYVLKNFNNPPSGFNGLRAFDVRSNTAHINMAMITIDHAPAPLGFHLDVGFGETFHIIHLGNRDPDAWHYFKQAYISLKPKSWHGVEIDAGEFVTSAGAEVIESNANYNYSRSLIFNWAIPYSHTGFRLQYPIGSHFTGSFQVVNGWNNVEPINSGKTYGFTGAYAWKKVTWNNNYYVGPEHYGTTKGWRHMYDTSVVVNQTDKLSWYLNFDYDHDKNVGPGSTSWYGLGWAGRYQTGSKTAIATRLEFFKDTDGTSTGLAQTVKEWTLTGEYKLTNWLMTRGEYRVDWSDKPFFEKEKQPAGAKTMSTLTFALIAYFAPKK